jgi:hypothetical protein
MIRRRREPERERPGPQRYDCDRKGQEEGPPVGIRKCVNK